MASPSFAGKLLSGLSKGLIPDGSLKFLTSGVEF